MSQLPVLASSSTLSDIRKLTVPVLRKYLARQQHHKESSSHRSKTGHKSSRKPRHSSHVSRTSSPNHSGDPQASARGWHSRTGTQANAWDRARARSRSPTSIHHRHANLSSSSESSSDGSSTTWSHYRRRKPLTSSSSSPQSLPPIPRPRYHKKHKQRRQHSSSSSESDSDVEPGSFVSFPLHPSRHCVQRIRRGKYIKFDHLLPSVDTIHFQSWYTRNHHSTNVTARGRSVTFSHGCKHGTSTY